MYISSLELIEYRRFKLLPFKRFKANFTKSMVVLVGTNGCGKSSILAECSPWPADRKFYRKGGSKTIEIEDRGNHYKLISDFSSDKPRYLFYKNDEGDLNQGGTMTTYKELVKSEFGITDDIHEVLSGSRSFYNMAVAEKRKWFTRMPGVDYEYAIQYFKKLKEATKSTADVLKNMSARLIKEKSLLLSKEAVQEIESELEHLRSTLHNFLHEKSSRVVDKPYVNFAEMTRNSNALLDKLKEIYASIQKRVNIDEAMVSINDVNNEITVEKKLKDDLVDRLMDATGKYDKLNQEYSSIKVVDPESELGKLTQELERQTAELTHADFLQKNGLDLNDPSAIRSLVYTLKNNESLIVELQNFELTEAQVSSSYIFQLSSALNDLRAMTKHVQTSIGGLETKLAHLEKHRLNPDTVCPACNHTWKPGYTDDDYIEATKLIERKRQEQKNLAIMVSATETNLEQAQVQMSFYTSLMALPNHNPNTNNYVNTIRGYLFDNPGDLSKVYNSFLSDAALCVNMAATWSRIQEIESVIRAKKDNIDNIRNDLSKSIESLTAKIEERSVVIRDLYAKKQKLEFEVRQEKKLQEMIATTSTYCTSIDDLVRKEGRYRLNVYLNNCIYDLKSSIAVREQKIGVARMQQAVVQKLSAEIEYLSNQLVGMQAACETLSPTNGLIAKGLHNFLQFFTGEMNGIIAEVATYPLEVVCNGATDEDMNLDFKMEVITNNQVDDSSPDTSKTSSGQKDIINMAFNLASIKAYGLSDHPLFMDEFGVHMDHTHRNKAVRYAEKLMIGGNFQQCFLVSHHSSAYSNLANAQVIVIHKDNVVMPSDMKVDTDVIMEL